MKIFYTLLLMVAGCESIERDNARLQDLHGQPVARLVTKWGKPTQELYRGDTVIAYEWSVSASYIANVPTSQYTHGYIGTTPFNATTLTTRPESRNISCLIRIYFNLERKIVNSEAHGNKCSYYTDRL